MRVTTFGPADIYVAHQPDRAALAAIFGISQSTAIPVHHQAIRKPSKNYRRSVNVQVLATLGRRIVHVSQAWPGNPNDIVIAKATIHLPEAITTLTDGGYRSMPGATPPPNDDAAQLAVHKRLRARIEHSLAQMKDWQTLRQCRRRRNAINLAVRCVAYLGNLRLAHS
jgi:hypothetical protein